MQRSVTDAREIENKVRAYVIDSFLGERDAEAFDNDSDLLAMLDSLQILRMVIALESLYGIKVHENELSADNLGSVRKLAGFLTRKQGEQPPRAAKAVPTA
jgi:acyl carrier protein